MTKLTADEKMIWANVFAQVYLQGAGTDVENAEAACTEADGAITAVRQVTHADCTACSASTLADALLIDISEVS